MGANQSTTVNNLVESLNENITNIVNSQTQSVSVQQSNINELSINMRGAKVIGCDFNFSQKIQANQNTKALSSFNSSQALETLMDNAIDNTVSQNQKSVNDMFSTSFSNQEQDVSMSTILKNIVKTNINQSNEQAILKKFDNLNKNTLDFSELTFDCTKNRGGIDASQSIFSKQTIEAITGLITEALMKDQQVAKAVSKSAQDQSSENKGLSSVISAATGPLLIIGVLVLVFFFMGGKDLVTGGFSTVSDPKKLIKLIIGIVILIVTIVLVIKFKNSKKSKQYIRIRKDPYSF
jgi:hypothetical protein